MIQKEIPTICRETQTLAGWVPSRGSIVVAPAVVLVAFVMAMLVTTAVVMVAVVAAVIAVVATAIIVMATVVTVVIAQGATSTAAQCRADQASVGAAKLLADHIAAGRAQRAANGGFGTTATIRTNRATRCSAYTGADGGTRGAADLLANHRAQCPAQGTTNTCFGIAGKRGAAGQAHGHEEHQGKFHGEDNPGDCDGADPEGV